MRSVLLILLSIVTLFARSYDEDFYLDGAEFIIDFGGIPQEKEIVSSLKMGPQFEYAHDNYDIKMFITPLLGYRYQFDTDNSYSTNLFMTGVGFGNADYNYSRDFGYELTGFYLMGKQNKKPVNGYRTAAKLLFFDRFLFIEAAYVDLGDTKSVECIIGVDLIAAF